MNALPESIWVFLNAWLAVAFLWKKLQRQRDLFNYSGHKAPSLKMGFGLAFVLFSEGSTSGLYGDYIFCSWAKYNWADDSEERNVGEWSVLYLPNLTL